MISDKHKYQGEELSTKQKYWVCEKCEKVMSPRPKGVCLVLYGICDECHKSTNKTLCKS